MAQADDVVKCFLYLDDSNEGDGISNLKLQKLMYYAQGFYSAIYDNPLFENEIQAWTHGPVVPDIYHTYKKHGRAPIPLPGDFDRESLNQEEFSLVEEVFEVFGQYSAWRLRTMTHEERPWVNHENEAAPIPFPEIIEYFKTRVNA